MKSDISPANCFSFSIFLSDDLQQLYNISCKHKVKIIVVMILFKVKSIFKMLNIFFCCLQNFNLKSNKLKTGINHIQTNVLLKI